MCPVMTRFTGISAAAADKATDQHVPGGIDAPSDPALFVCAFRDLDKAPRFSMLI
jgi:hypothetical protein